MNTKKTIIQNPAYEAANSEDKSLLDYAHGHVTDTKGKRVDGQQIMACFYEYARECPVLCNLALAFQKRGNRFDLDEDRRIIQDTLGRVDETVLYNQWLWVNVSPYFPHKPWRDIPLKSRPRTPDNIFPLPTLRMPECAYYGSKAVEAKNAAWEEYERRKSEANTEQEMALVNERYGIPPPAVWRLVDANEIVAVFRLDTRLSKSRIVDCFKAWLELPENSALFAPARTIENTNVGTAADRLKDLAIWRLYTRFVKDCKAVRNFLLEHRKYENGKRLSFLNDKPGRGTAGKSAIKAMESRGDPYFLDAVRRAKRHRTKLFFFEGHDDRRKEWMDDLSKRTEAHFGKFFDRGK